MRRLRAGVVVSDGMLSAFENVGWPDPQVAGGPVQAGGHGGELLRGGYAQAVWSSLAGPLGAAAAAELFRRMTTRRLSLSGRARRGRTWPAWRRRRRRWPADR